MANTKTKKKTESKTNARTEQAAPITDITEKESSRISVKDIDPNQYVVVRNGFQGKLVYRSSRTNELFVWDEFGAEQEMELKELKDAKNSHKKMFVNNWFMFDEEWIVDYLGVRQFYKNSIRIEDFDNIFKESPSCIEETILSMPEGQRSSVAYRARQLIDSGEIDSRKVISALEDALHTELIER